MTPYARVLVVVAVLSSLLVCASSASAALTKAQQMCVNTQNANWQKLAASFGKVNDACIKTHNKGTTGDIDACVFSTGGLKIVKAIDKLLNGYFAKCDDVDADGQPKLPGVFVGEISDPVFASLTESRRSLAAVYGPDVEAAAVTDAEDKTMASCQAAVAKTFTKCADVRRKVFNACKKSALAVGKEPFPAGATTPAELQTCFGFDPKSAIAKACDAPEDKTRQALAKQCVDKGVDLTVAFPQCGSGLVDAVHECIEAPAVCAVCQAVNSVDALAIDCDAADDLGANGSCKRLELLVPAYANPCCGDGPAMWADLETAAAGPTHLNVILNPASGPGAGPEIDPNYVNVGPVGPLLDVRAAGATIYGYVSTSFATRPIGDAKVDIDLYYTASYWRGAGVQVDGIFLDEMSGDLPDVGYYQELRDYVHAKAASARVIANPGQPSTQDTSGGLSGFTVMDYATAADVLVTFEGNGAGYRFGYSSPAWVNALPSSHFAHLVHGEADLNDMADDVDLARTRKAGMIYVTDDVLAPNPWDALATYWLDELDVLRLP